MRLIHFISFSMIYLYIYLRVDIKVSINGAPCLPRNHHYRKQPPHYVQELSKHINQSTYDEKIMAFEPHVFTVRVFVGKSIARYFGIQMHEIDETTCS